jgi:DNA gyrase/topoisomerase IV subunit A
MKPFKSERSYNDTNGARIELLLYITDALYYLYKSKPSAVDEGQINSTLDRYEHRVSSLAQALEESSEQEDERALSSQVRDLASFLQKRRVSGDKFLEQRDEIAEQITKRASAITNGAQLDGADLWSPEEVLRLCKKS